MDSDQPCARAPKTRKRHHPAVKARVRADYGLGLTGPEFEYRYGVPKHTLYGWAQREGWTKKAMTLGPAPDLPPPIEDAAAPEALTLRRHPPTSGNARLAPRARLFGFNPGGDYVLRANQRPPEGDWATWVFMGGRGAGKTLAGALWLKARAEAPRAEARTRTLALVGPTLHDVREVMVGGVSGLLNLPGDRPVWQASRRRLEFPNGAEAFAFSAEEPERLRGPQFEAAWADEFAIWPKGEETLALLRMGLRLGADPRLVVTTTPRPIPALRRLLAEPTCVDTRSATAENAMNLAPSFLDGLKALYGGTRREAQELDGVLLEDAEGALWRLQDLRACRAARPEVLERVVVAVDPPATAGGAACGIVVAGRMGEHAYVLADRTVSGLTPDAWARHVTAAAREFGAHAIVAEGNQGGDMVRGVLATAGPPCAIRTVHATAAKRVRAEPVAALYEQGRVHHCGAFPALEEELMALGAPEGPTTSPDRADALVWAVTDLLLDRRGEGPRVRWLDW